MNSLINCFGDYGLDFLSQSQFWSFYRMWIVVAVARVFKRNFIKISDLMNDYYSDQRSLLSNIVLAVSYYFLYLPPRGGGGGKNFHDE